MHEGIVHQEWLKAIKKEIKMLVDSGMFARDTMNEGETSTPVMETFKVERWLFGQIKNAISRTQRLTR